MTTETKKSRMPFILGVLAIVIVSGVAFFLLTDDGSSANEPLPTAEPLMQKAAENLKNAESFQLEMRQTGTPTLITELSGIEIFFDRATATFLQPDRISAFVSVQIETLTQDFELIVIGTDQYGKNRLVTQGQWAEFTLAEGFSGSDIQDDTYGIHVALANIRDIEIIGRDDLDGIPVYHLKGNVEAAQVQSVTVGLMGTADGLIPIDVYVRVRDEYPARLILTEPRLDGETALDPTVWTIDFAGYNRDDVEVNEPEIDTENEGSLE